MLRARLGRGPGDKAEDKACHSGGAEWLATQAEACHSGACGAAWEQERGTQTDFKAEARMQAYDTGAEAERQSCRVAHMRIDAEAETQRDTEAETQRDTPEAETHRDTKQRGREAERYRGRVAERQRHRGTEAEAWTGTSKRRQ